MIGFILAAGFGKRLRPLTNHIPKALVPVCSIPLLQRNLTALQSHGFDTIAVNAHYLSHCIDAFSETATVPFTVIHETGTIRGTGGALYGAQEFLSQEAFFCVVNGDIFSNASFRKYSDIFSRSDCMAMLVAAPALEQGTIYADAVSGEYSGTVAQHNTAAGEALICADFIGLALYRKDVLNFITEADFSVVPIWRRIQEKGYSVRVHIDTDLWWYDVGTPQAYAQCHFDVLDSKIDVKIPDSIILDVKNKRAFPRSLKDGTSRYSGSYYWSDAQQASSRVSLQRCIVFSESTFAPDAKITNAIITPWGVIQFGQ